MRKTDRFYLFLYRAISAPNEGDKCRYYLDILRNRLIAKNGVNNLEEKHLIELPRLTFKEKVEFIKDFFQNIINLSHPFMEKESINFYYKNQQEGLDC